MSTDAHDGLPPESSDTQIRDADLDAFTHEPTELRFVELRDRYRQQGAAAMLYQLCTTWAPRCKDVGKAAEAWSEAGEVGLAMGYLDHGVACLQQALESEPGHARSVDLLVEVGLREGWDAFVAELLEKELAELQRRSDAEAVKTRKPAAATQARREQQHQRLATLCAEKLGRIDRAVWHWQQAWRLNPQNTKALAEARALFASVGDTQTVARLLQAELDVLGKQGSAAQKAAVRLELGKLAQANHDITTAIRHLEEAVRLDASLRPARETLAELYVVAGDETPQARSRAANILTELGKHHLRADAPQLAAPYFRRALAADGNQAEAGELLEAILRHQGAWSELDALLQAQLDHCGEAPKRAALLRKRTALLQDQLAAAAPRGSLVSTLSELSTYEAPYGQAALELREVLQAEQRWPELVSLIETQLASAAGRLTPGQHVDELLRLATLARDQLADRDRAAQLLHHALTVMPDHPEALARYVDHFRERRDWRGLCELHEYALDNAREAGAPIPEQVKRLEEIAQVAELRMGDIPRAVEAWRRIGELQPHNSKVTEAMRRLLSRERMWAELVETLEAEVAQAVSPAGKRSALRRMAQTLRERQIEPGRAIAVYEQLVSEDPDDDAALKALLELYEKQADEAGLAETLKRQLELDARRLLHQGQDPNPRTWPVAKRTERLAMLRKLAALCDARLGNLEGVVYACSATLELLPGDRDALERLERVLERAGDPRLEQTLEYHAAATHAPAERNKLFKRLAELAQARGDDFAALERWEKALAVSTSDAQALQALADLYERLQRWHQLAETLAKLDALAPAPMPGTTEAALRVAALERHAAVELHQLQDHDKATALYERMLTLSPKHAGALTALRDLYRRSERWRELTEVMARHQLVLRDNDVAAATALAMERAAVLEHKLGAPTEAMRALEEIVTDLNPHAREAYAALRRLYESRGAYDAAVRLAEREYYLATDVTDKVARGLEIGAMCQSQLGDALRALSAFERVLALDERNLEALIATAELLGKLGRHKEELKVLERWAQQLVTVDERRPILLRIADVAEHRLEDPKAAFKALRRAHDEHPSDDSLERLRTLAGGHGLWRDYADVLIEARKALAASLDRSELRSTYVTVSRELAALYDSRHKEPTKALALLVETLGQARRELSLLSEIERLATALDTRQAYRQVTEAIELGLAAASPAERVTLHLRRAQLYEQQLGDLRLATSELMAAFSWGPDRDEPVQALYALAPKSRAWPEVVSVETALVDRAQSVAMKLHALRRKAAVIEEHLKDAPRAFRTYLVAFLLDPHQAETVSTLWRLARTIGQYRDADKHPKPDTTAAAIADAAAVAQAQAVAHATTNAQPSSAGRPPSKRAQTEEIALSDLAEIATTQERGDATEPLVLPPEPPPRANRQTALSSARQRQLAGAPPPVPSPTARPPMLPARAHRVSTPTLPSRAFASPWEEYAYAYEQLPAATTEAKVQWCYAAAEVWEAGAKDPARAFDTLARAYELAYRDRDERLRHDAKERFHRVALEHGMQAKLGDFYQRLAESARTPDEASALLLEVSTIRTQQNKPREAEAMLRRITGMRPDDLTAREALAALYRAEGRWVELTAALEERTDPRLGMAAPANERPALLAELAQIYTEKLGRPHDAIEVYERLRQLTPNELTVHQRLADQYRSISRWTKAIDSLGKVVELDERGPHGHAAQATIASLYWRELELPDRAIDAFSELVARWPDDTSAWHALDQLYAQHARWPELAEVLRHEAALAPTPEAQLEFLLRRATVLTDHDPRSNLDEAVSTLRHARTLAATPEADAQIAEKLVAALVSAERPRDAVTLIEQRYQQLTDAQAPTGERAAMLLRKAQLHQEPLAEPDEARAAIEAALNLVPEHPTALALLAALTAEASAPDEFIAIKLRQAESTHDEDARLQSLMEAGLALRDRTDDRAGAKLCFERVLSIRPYHADATWALAELAAQVGDAQSAAEVLARRLQDTALAPEERARILTQLAALARRAGVDPMAERHLREALEHEPAHLPAVIALAEMLKEQLRYSELQGFLRGCLEDPERAASLPPAVIADLHRRLALAYEQTGEHEDAYQTLQTADRMARSHLLVKLALGENRFRARRWREAALHLSPLGQHEEAPRYAQEVAQGLYHAALAEIRSLRPERAPALYLRAVELFPTHGASLHALAELAMEQGDKAKAQAYLRRHAESATNPDERVRLFEALGDLSLRQLGDDASARACFAQAVASAQPLETRHLPLLTKLLRHQLAAIAAGELAEAQGAGRTTELMAAFDATAPARAERLLSATRLYQQAGDLAHARLAAERAANETGELDAIELASSLMLALDDPEATAQFLGRHLATKTPPKHPEEAMLRAGLWNRLGEARVRRGDLTHAMPAFEKAIQLAADSPGGLAARRNLVTLARQVEPDPEARQPRPDLTEHIRVVLADSGEAGDLLNYADELRRAHRAPEAALALGLARAAGHELDLHQLAFFAAHEEAPLRADFTYRTQLDVPMRRLLVDDACTQRAPIVAALSEAAALLWPDAEQALAFAGIDGAQRIAANATGPAATMFPKLANAMQTGPAILYQAELPEGEAVRAICGTRPLIVADSALLQPNADVELIRVAMARALEHTRPEYFALLGQAPAQATRLWEACLRLFGTAAQKQWVATQAPAGDKAYDERVRAALSVKLRTKIEQTLRNLAEEEWPLEDFLAGAQRAADRAALLLGGAPSVVVAALAARHATPNHVFGVIARQGWARARRALLDR